MFENCTMIPTADMPRDKWLAERRKGIGGSDAAAIVGLSPWATPYTVYMDKLGLLPDKEDMPAGAAFMIIHKPSVISPMKIKDFKGHVDPPGLSGDLIEFRMLYDAFVLGKKADGVLVGCLPGTVATTPTITMDGAKATIASTGATAIYYTTNGSDPRYSVDAKLYSAAVTLAAGDQLRAYAAVNGKFNSDVAAKDYLV